MTFTDSELGLLVASIALAGVILGSVVAGAFALLTSWLGAKREHKRWVRQERLGIYLNYFKVVDRVASTGTREDLRLLADAMSEVLIVGDEHVYNSGRRLMDVALDSLRKPKAERDDESSRRFVYAKNDFAIAARAATGFPVG